MLILLSPGFVVILNLLTFAVYLNGQEMKRYLLLLAALCMAMAGYAQKKNFSYTFYGQVRGDLFYNSRANAEIVDGLFHLYPKDKNPDADGNDLNATANGSFYLLYSRLGVDVKGPDIGKAVATAKLEADFRAPGLGEIGGAGWTNLASALRRCVSADAEPFDRCAFPAV